LKTEAQHKILWSTLHKNISCEWLRFFSFVSGIVDIKYVPEDVFYSIIEPCLNDFNYSAMFADKNFYVQRFKSTVFPRTILHNVSGEFLDENYNIITNKEAEAIFLSYKKCMVVKPSLESGGGRNVVLLNHSLGIHRNKNGDEITFDDIKARWKKNYIIQERVEQHEFFSRFNPTSLNTIRLVTYRSPFSEKIKVLKCILRMGVNGSDVDNENAGGISVGILPNGMLNKFAYSKYGDAFQKHPSTLESFGNNHVPFLDQIFDLATKMAAQVPTQRLISFDITVDSAKQVKIIEINTSGQGLLFLQTFGGSLFGDMTQEVIDFCAVKYNQLEFKHFRLVS